MLEYFNYIFIYICVCIYIYIYVYIYIYIYMMCVYVHAVCISGTEYTKKTNNSALEDDGDREKVGRHVGYYREQMRGNLS